MADGEAGSKVKERNKKEGGEGGKQGGGVKGKSVISPEVERGRGEGPNTRPALKQLLI